jgi:hypothetical protein
VLAGGWLLLDAAGRLADQRGLAGGGLACSLAADTHGAAPALHHIFAPRLNHAAGVGHRCHRRDKRAALYITGALSVEAKVRSFTALPGFYRSFATREHVLIGRVQPRRIAALCNLARG